MCYLLFVETPRKFITASFHIHMKKHNDNIHEK